VRADRLTKKLSEIHKAERVEKFHLGTLTHQTFCVLIDSLSMMSLFAQIRLVLIEMPEKKNPFAEKILGSLQHISSGTSVVLHYRSNTPTAQNLAQLPKDAAHIELEKMEGEKLQFWLSREVTRFGSVSINAGALHLLAQYAGEDLDAAYQALEQVALFADGEPINEQIVKRVITIIPDAEQFALLDLLDSGSIPRAEQLAEALLAQGSNAFVILAMIARNQLNRVAVRGAVEARATDEPLRRALSMTPWVYERAKKQIAKPNLPSMKQVIAAIVRADTRLKGKSLGPEAIIGELLAALAPRSSRHRDNTFSGNEPVRNAADSI